MNKHLWGYREGIPDRLGQRGPGRERGEGVGSRPLALPWKGGGGVHYRSSK